MVNIVKGMTNNHVDLDRLHLSFSLPALEPARPPPVVLEGICTFEVHDDVLPRRLVRCYEFTRQDETLSGAEIMMCRQQRLSGSAGVNEVVSASLPY